MQHVPVSILDTHHSDPRAAPPRRGWDRGARAGVVAAVLTFACAALEQPPDRLVEPNPPAANEPRTLLQSGEEVLAHWNALRGDAYALDSVERSLDAGEARRVRCSPEALVAYRGDVLRYATPVTVNPVFRERLRSFEAVVADVAREVYGRPPRRILHFGAYSCRTSRNRSYRLSEHALGNAIDIAGFDFGPATKTQPMGVTLPTRLRGPFQVRVLRHWQPRRDDAAQVHARFLHTLTTRLLERNDIFRGFVGPGHPGHDDHLHFDVAPWRYVRL